MPANPTSTVQAVDLAELKSIFDHMSRRHMPYGYGDKLPLDLDPDAIKAGTPVDCSGFVRYILRAAGGPTLPDGSQMQREWAEANLRKIATYADANTYMTDRRLFIAFIKPWANGCRGVGHVWLVANLDSDQHDAETMESYGGHGVGSRSWDARVLRQQVYSCFELPVK